MSTLPPHHSETTLKKELAARGAEGAIAISLILNVGGCGPTATQPFVEYHEALAEFQLRSDEVLEGIQKRAEAGFTSSSPLAEELKFSDVVFTWEGDDSTQPKVDARPLYVLLRETKRGAASLNEGMVQYARLLSTLAGAESKDAERIDSMAKTANANHRSARDVLDLNLDDKQVAIVATVGAEILRQKIQNQRRQFLSETMDGAQATVDEFSEFMVMTMDVVAGDVQRTYLEWVPEKQEVYDTIEVPTGKGVARDRAIEEQRRVLFEVLNRNDQTAVVLESVRTLREGYRKLGTAHQQMRESLDRRGVLLDEVKRLYGDARRLQSLYKELAGAD